MKFVSLRELRTKTADIRKNLEADREIVLTANGHPIAIVAQVDENNFEERLKAIRRSRARALFDRMHEKAAARGVDKLTMPQIDAIIEKSRHERRRGK